MKRRFVIFAVISAMVFTLFTYVPLTVNGAEGETNPYAALLNVSPDQFTPEALLGMNGPNFSGEYSYRKNGGYYGFWEAWLSVGVMNGNWDSGNDGIYAQAVASSPYEPSRSGGTGPMEGVYFTKDRDYYHVNLPPPAKLPEQTPPTISNEASEPVSFNEIVKFAGKYWIVIGRDGAGVASQKGTMTLLLTHDPTVEFASITTSSFNFPDNPDNTDFDKSKLKQLLQDEESLLSKTDKSIIIPRTDYYGEPIGLFWLLTGVDARELEENASVFWYGKNSGGHFSDRATWWLMPDLWELNFVGIDGRVRRWDPFYTHDSNSVKYALRYACIIPLSEAVTINANIPQYIPFNERPLSFASGGYGAVNDGVDYQSLLFNQVYFGAYDHAVDFPNFVSAQSGTTMGTPVKEGVNRPILWRVVGEEENDGKLTLLSRYVLDGQQYHSRAVSAGVDYVTADIRKWLNTDFLAAAYSALEERIIAQTDITVEGYYYDIGKNTSGRSIPGYPKTISGDKIYLMAPAHGWAATNLGDPDYYDLTEIISGMHFNMKYPEMLRNNNGSGVLLLWARGAIVDDSTHAMRVDWLGGANTPTSIFGVQPVMKLEPHDVIFISEISTEPNQFQTKSSENYKSGNETNYSGNDTDMKNYCLTIVNPEIKLTNVSVGGISIANGSDIPETFGGSFTLTGSGNGHDKLAYKIVQAINGNRLIVGYGTGSVTSITVDTKGLTEGGDYTLYIWAQKDNAINSNEGSMPMYFKLGANASIVATPVTVNPTPSTVYVNGVETAFEAYNIGGSNFFKLRDLAYVLSGTEKQFEVGYDDATKAIILTSGKAYTPTGNQEMIPGDGKAKPATPTASKIYLDGDELNLTVYNIGGNNFFKLRDLMQAIDVYVGYDNATRAITLDTSKGYTIE